MTHDVVPISAAVLAGGQSRRMGRDKALLPLVEGGPPMLELVLQRLRQIADDVLVVASDREEYAAFGARVVPDAFPGSGALGGIHAALQAARHEHCLVVACDMPFLSQPLLGRMRREPRDYDVLAPVIPGESRQGKDGLVYQTLHAIYGKRALPAIEASLGQGVLQVVRFFAEVRLRTINVEELRRWDPDLHSFFNANTPGALELARDLQGREPGTAAGRFPHT